MFRELYFLALPPLLAAAAGAQAQEIQRHERHPTLPIVEAITVPATAETLYLSGEVASLANRTAPANTPQAYGDTEAQTTNVLRKIAQTLARRGYGLGDVVKLTVFLVGAPENQGRLDMEGFTRAYRRFFGTAEQPNLVARSTVQVAALGNAGYLVEIEAVAAKSRRDDR
jgi:enamine deaminase RidA (YjgF/YER057c/UK114 family)